MQISGRILEHEGKHYIVFAQTGSLKALPVVQADDGNWHVDVVSLGGVTSEQTPNAQGGVDCTVRVPCLEVQMTIKDPQ